MAQLYGPPSDGSIIPHELEDAIAADVANDSSPIGGALRAAGLGRSGVASDWTPTEQIATLCDFGSGSKTWAVATDSTGNDYNDWTGTFLHLLKGRVPTTVGIDHYPWQDAEQAWRATPTVTQEGAGTAGSGGVVMEDTFTRTGEIVGSTADNGAVWTSDSPGNWSADGSAAVNSIGTGGISFDTGSKDAVMEAELTVVTANVAASGGNPNLRFYLGSKYVGLGDVGIWGQLSLTSSGAASFMMYSRFGGVNATIVAADYSIGLTTNTATPQRITVRVAIDVQSVTARTIVGDTVKDFTATITEAQYGEMGTLAGVRASNWTNQGVIDSLTMSTPVTEALPAARLSFYNGGVAGTRLEYQEQRVAEMYGALPPIDTLIVSGGHNYGTQTPEEFVTAVDRFVTAYLAVQPESKILVSSQNPQKDPSGTAGPHAARQAALRQWAKENGHEYVPAFETFKALPDGGDSLINTDGIHPTVPPLYTTDASGATTWAQVLADMVDARRIAG